MLFRSSPTGFPLMGSVANSYRSGIELDFTYILYDGGNYDIRLVNNSAFSNNMIEADNGEVFEPLYTPKAIINQWVILNLGERFMVSVDAKYHSVSYIGWEAPRAVTPQFVIYNAQVGYKFKRGSINIFASNLTSEQYFTNGYVVDGSPHYFVNQPLNYTIAFNLKF